MMKDSYFVDSFNKYKKYYLKWRLANIFDQRSSYSILDKRKTDISVDNMHIFS